jgi:hypothetical protein
VRKAYTLAAAAVACGLVLAAGSAAATSSEKKITDNEPYVRHDGTINSDETMRSCSSDFSDEEADAPTPTPATDEGGGERQANEPSAAIDPSNSAHMVAGSNDYCNVPTGGDAWAGFYYSNNTGSSWVDSLVPGYAQDTSAAGQASPQYRFVLGTGDPVQAWDRTGHLYYGFIGFNRVKPQNASIFVAKYNWPAADAAPDYQFTSVVSRGTPGFGHFEDKIGLEVDRGVSSPYAGNVYVCWARFTGSGSNNFVYFARSTNGGQTYQIQKISESIHGSQFCDIAVTKNGTVFVAWRQFAFKPNKGQRQNDAVAWAKSTNGGATFTKPAVATNFIHWDVGDRTANPKARAAAEHQACLSGDSTELDACSAETEEPNSRDCGDGPFRCQSGYVFFREDSQVRITADPTADGDPDAAYVVYNATVPGSQTETGTTYGTVDTGIGSQGQIYFIKTENGGATWTGGDGLASPTRITPDQAEGHQFFPDIDANAGELHAMWQDSRDDTASGPPTTDSGGDYRTVPIANQWVAQNPPGSVSVGHTIGVDAYYARSIDFGASWIELKVSTASTMPQYEQFGNRDIPFFGDYNYISAVGNTVLLDWTDEREAQPGDDPRYTDGDGTDGFDVHQCRPDDNPSGADGCPNAGGLDQNIFGAIVTNP